MLYKISHGKTVYYTKDFKDKAKIRPTIQYRHLDCIHCGEALSLEYDGRGQSSEHDQCPGLAEREVFRYMFDGDGITDTTTAQLDALGDAMAADDELETEVGDSDIPPVFTYFGQFIDHDITANTDREDAALDRFNIDKPDLAPADRSDVEANKINLRRGTLGLDSLYGDGPIQSDLATKAEAALRDPGNPAKMRTGTVTPVTTGGPFLEPILLPTDRQADIPRYGSAVDDGSLDLSDVRQLESDEAGLMSDDEIRRLPLIGDARNDENLIVSQLHLAFLRLHNVIVDNLDPKTFGGKDGLFAEARRQTTWIYQWLVVNEYLPAICDPDTVNAVVDGGAPIYQEFYDNHGDAGDGCSRPMPIEFSVAAFRFGHSMVRGSYDFNRNFGEPGTGLDRAAFGLLFQFTGSGGFNGEPTLPDNWIIEWDRFLFADAADRAARSIDTNLALPLNQLPEGMNSPPTSVLGRLAARNLRRSYVLNLPTAQSVLSSLKTNFEVSIRQLTKEELRRGKTRKAVVDAGFDDATPLWFYILKEAEERAGGQHLGELGSRIVAETLVGLINTDPSSYLNAPAGWDPSQAAIDVRSLADLLRATGLMAEA